MRKKMKLKPCIEVPFADKLYEGYEVLEGRAIIANVSVDKVKDMMADFIGMYDEPLFFFLELPGHLPEGLEEGFIDEIKKDVYYLDGLDQKNSLNILNEIGDVLCNDGLSSFGFGVLGGEDEIMFDHLVKLKLKCFWNNQKNMFTQAKHFFIFVNFFKSSLCHFQTFKTVRYFFIIFIIP